VLVEEDGLFTAREGSTWDFKDQFPFSFSDGYFAGICRLICAFANSHGGVIVFGVHDGRRTGGHNKVRVNLDRFEQAFRQLTGVDFQYDFRPFIHETNGAVDVLLVAPRPNGAAPLRFRTKLGGYEAGVLWVRAGPEVVAATPPNFPLLFCGTDPSETVAERDGSIPPSPATMKKFVGRVEVLDKLFAWLQTSDEPRNYLHGKGGSGKTTIAHEFARLVKDFGGKLLIEGRHSIDVVLFLSAKERFLVPSTMEVDNVDEPDFSDERSLLEQILYFGGWTTDRDTLAKTSLEYLRQEIASYFDITSALIVLDDVDTLTTKGIDPGGDFLYKTLCRSQKPSRVLYTLRNAPSQSLHNSIDVPRLDGSEYETFVAECASQFSVSEPSKIFRDTQLADISERRPLVIESIIALSRTAGNYDRAADLFKQHAGDNVRDYVFSREWDALASEPLSRLLLAALAELKQTATFTDLETVMQVDASRVRDAVGSVREMFLQVDDAGSEALFSLAPLTRSFVNSRGTALVGFSQVRERVKTFKQIVRVTSPAVAAILAKVHRLLPYRMLDHPQDKLEEAWRLVHDPKLEADVTEDCRFKSCLGYVCALQSAPRLTEAREAFEYAVRMRHEPAIAELRAWFGAEKKSGAHEGWCEKIADIVIGGRSYTEVEKINMISRKAGSINARARERVYTDSTDARKNFGEALLLHLRAFRLNCDRGDTNSERSEEFGINTAYQWFNLALRGDNPWEIFDQARTLSGAVDIYLDPVEKPFEQAVDRLARMPGDRDAVSRSKARAKGLADTLSARKLWLDPAVGEHLARVMREFDENMERRLSSPRTR
jgi:hypothetical protein